MNFKISSILLFPCIIFLCVQNFISENSYAQLNSANLIQYSEKDGLPGSQVYNVLTDRLGYLWTGTINGLARYDGYEFKRFYYNPNDTASIHGLIVWSLFQDHTGKIWVGNSPSFLNAYDPVTNAFQQYRFTHLIKHPANVEMNIQSICEDNNGRIYFGVNTYYRDKISSALLYKDQNNDTIKLFKTSDSLDIQNVVRFAKDKKGNICLLSYSGLFKIDTKGKLTKIHSLDEEYSRTHEYLTDINFDKNGHLWGLTKNERLYDLDPETGNYATWLSNVAHASKGSRFFNDRLIIDNDNNIWIGTNDGVQFFNSSTGKFSIFNKGSKKELEHTPVADLTLDSFGTLWIGSIKDGLIKYENKPQLKSYTPNTPDKNSLTVGWANFIYEASDGKIWITTSSPSNNSGINILDSRTGALQKITYSGISNRINGVTAFWQNAPGEFYIGVYNGLYSFSEATHKLKRIALQGVPDTSIITYNFKDTRENEWLCTFSGLYKKTKAAQLFKKYDLTLVKGSDASSNEITLVYESKKHGLWILTNNGLFLYNYNTDKIERHGYNKNEGDIFVTQDINSFYEEPGGTSWVGTWQGGLSRYIVGTKKIKTYTRNDGLPSMSIQAILADEKNNSLWLSTFEGLSRFNLKTEQFNNFSIADGIQSQLFADGSFLKTSKGLFAFGGSNGITIFNPDEITKNSVPPKVFLTDLKVFNKSIIPGENSLLKKPIYETAGVTLAYNQNNISLEFIALHYSDPSKNKYAYKLENYDNEWREIGNLHVAFYPNLPPGEYLFHVKAANNNGVWNEKGATLKITVNPPWWRTVWAYIIYVLLFITAAFTIDRYLRHRLILKEGERNQARELEHAKEIEKAYIKLEETHETLIATQSQLIQSEKMASLGELTAGIAHEIQNPLNFVNNFSEVNKELLVEMNVEIEKGNYNNAKDIAKDITDNEEKINHHGKRADAIVKGMLQHSRTSSGKKEPTDINALADEYLRLSYHGLRAKDKNFNATFKTDFDESIGNINIVPQDIGRVMLNLITNAFYVVDEKKKQILDGYVPTVSVSTKKINEKVEIKVKDNGIGIPEKVLDKIFQPFFTTKPTGIGTGLGLSLSYDIVKMHGGEIKVNTREREFTEFVVQLPILSTNPTNTMSSST